VFDGSGAQSVARHFDRRPSISARTSVSLTPNGTSSYECPQLSGPSPRQLPSASTKDLRRTTLDGTVEKDQLRRYTRAVLQFRFNV